MEAYVRVEGKWAYLYRAVDSSGATLDFLLSAQRDATAAKHFLARVLQGENHPAPRARSTRTNTPAARPPSRRSKRKDFCPRTASTGR